MNRYQTLILSLLVLAGVMFFFSLKSLKSVSNVDSFVRNQKNADLFEGRKTTANKEKEACASLERQRAFFTEKKAGFSASPPDASRKECTFLLDKECTREKAVENWEKLLDQLVEQKENPTQERVAYVKEVFDKLDRQDQLDNIHHSLNLLPDDQFPALYGILYDKTENPEVLDAIFSDALNRPEEIKNPLMKELVKDKEHPCYFESARILDVIGELQVTSQPTSSP